MGAEQFYSYNPEQIRSLLNPAQADTVLADPGYIAAQNPSQNTPNMSIAPAPAQNSESASSQPALIDVQKQAAENDAQNPIAPEPPPQAEPQPQPVAAPPAESAPQSQPEAVAPGPAAPAPVANPQAPPVTSPPIQTTQPAAPNLKANLPDNPFNWRDSIQSNYDAKAADLDSKIAQVQAGIDDGSTGASKSQLLALQAQKKLLDTAKNKELANAPIDENGSIDWKNASKLPYRAQQQLAVYQQNKFQQDAVKPLIAQQEAATASAKAQTDEANAKSQLFTNQAIELQKRNQQAILDEKQRQQELNKRIAERDSFIKEYGSTKIDPNRYWNNKSTGAKVVTAIFAGLTQAFNNRAVNGVSNQNPVLDTIKSQINNDIEAQKAELETKKGVVNASDNSIKFFMEKGMDARQAELAAQQAAYNQVQVQLNQIGSQYQAPQIQAGLQNLNAGIEAQKSKVSQDAATGLASFYLNRNRPVGTGAKGTRTIQTANGWQTADLATGKVRTASDAEIASALKLQETQASIGKTQAETQLTANKAINPQGKVSPKIAVKQADLDTGLQAVDNLDNRAKGETLNVNTLNPGRKTQLQSTAQAISNITGESSKEVLEDLNSAWLAGGLRDKLSQYKEEILNKKKNLVGETKNGTAPESVSSGEGNE